jgi:hypothetical protein
MSTIKDVISERSGEIPKTIAKQVGWLEKRGLRPARFVITASAVGRLREKIAPLPLIT